MVHAQNLGPGTHCRDGVGEQELYQHGDEDGVDADRSECGQQQCDDGGDAAIAFRSRPWRSGDSRPVLPLGTGGMTHKDIDGLAAVASVAGDPFARSRAHNYANPDYSTPYFA